MAFQLIYNYFEICHPRLTTFPVVNTEIVLFVLQIVRFHFEEIKFYFLQFIILSHYNRNYSHYSLLRKTTNSCARKFMQKLYFDFSPTSEFMKILAYHPPVLLKIVVVVPGTRLKIIFNQLSYLLK